MTICPCCRATVDAPDLAELITCRGITGHAAAILVRVWRQAGFPVMPDRLFDEMYADDPDGGPAPTRCYREMNIAIGELNKALAGSGVVVEHVGFKRGFRLTFDPGAGA